MKIKVYIHHNDDIKGSPYTFSFDATGSGYILLGTHEFEWEPPTDFDLNAAKISMLEKGLDTLEREHDTKVANIKEQIAKLQCLTFDPA